jgi:porphobilinogen synthase
MRCLKQLLKMVGWIKKAVVMESLLAFKRAGADGILTYYAMEVARWIKKET